MWRRDLEGSGNGCGSDRPYLQGHLGLNVLQTLQLLALVEADQGKSASLRNRSLTTFIHCHKLSVKLSIFYVLSIVVDRAAQGMDK